MGVARCFGRLVRRMRARPLADAAARSGPARGCVYIAVWLVPAGDGPAAADQPDPAGRRAGGRAGRRPRSSSARRCSGGSGSRAGCPPTSSRATRWSSTTRWRTTGPGPRPWRCSSRTTLVPVDRTVSGSSGVDARASSSPACPAAAACPGPLAGDEPAAGQVPVPDDGPRHPLALRPPGAAGHDRSSPTSCRLPDGRPAHAAAGT